MPLEPDRLYHTAAQVLGVAVDDLSEDSSPQNTGAWDSLNHLNLVIAFEMEFGVTLPPDAVLQIRTLGEARQILRDRGADV